MWFSYRSLAAICIALIGAPTMASVIFIARTEFLPEPYRTNALFALIASVPVLAIIASKQIYRMQCRKAESACPVCGSAMVLRTARRGPNKGMEFWGCSLFPQCRGTRPIQKPGWGRSGHRLPVMAAEPDAQLPVTGSSKRYWLLVLAGAAVFGAITTTILAFAFPHFLYPPADELTGRASVIDGDTIDIGGQRIRFSGIDAPEPDQPCRDGNDQEYRCGAVAANALDEYLAQSRPTRCEFVEWDRYGRYVGDCYRADGENIASWLVRNGHAFDWPQYSDGLYAGDQAAARDEKKGVWQGWALPPWLHRKERAVIDRNESGSLPFSLFQGAGCKIKGNISRNGRICHLPGQRYYSSTVINPVRGERWFCSEAEARAAGWRKSKV